MPGIPEGPLEPVYNLSTTDGTYFADGVLVHNCDALSGAAAMAIYGVEQLTGGQVAPGGPVRATFGASRSSPTLRAVLR